MLLNTGEPDLSLSPSSLPFPAQTVKTTGPTRTLTVTNDRGWPLQVTGAAIAGPQQADFVKVGDSCTGETVVAGESCQIQLSFAPSEIGPRSATLEIESNAPGSPHTVALSGHGLSAARPITADFNGDHVDDLVVGAPFESVGSVAGAGAINVIYGSPGGGLSSAGNQLFNEGTPGIAGPPETDDRFGERLAIGDFNNDGRDDLAIGVPGKDAATAGEPPSVAADAGAVDVIYGSPSGLTTAGAQLWNQDTAGIADSAEAGDSFGSALVADDFDGNGRDDLAIGVSSEDLASGSDAGAANVIYGSDSGLKVVREPALPPEPVRDPRRLGAGRWLRLLARGRRLRR